MLLNSLIAVNFIIPLLGMIIFCVNKKGLKVDHVFLFSAGFLYFWIMPLMTYQFKIDKIYNEIMVAYNKSYVAATTISEKVFANSFGVENYIVSDDIYIKYLIILFCIYAAFILGEFVTCKIKYKPKIISVFSIKPLDVILYIYLGVLIFMTVVSYDYYFKGFAQIITLTSFGLKAQMIALNIFLLTLMYMYFLNSKKLDRFNNIFINKYFVVYVASSLFLLSLGNRTWFICGVVSFFVVYTNYYKRISYKYFLVGTVIFFIFFLGIIPNIRAGNSDRITIFYTILLTLFDPFAMFNGLKYYLINNGIDYLNYPIILLSKVPSIIPTHLMPNKNDYYISLSDIGVDYTGVQAAWHTFPMLMIHFGIIGSILLAFISPIILQYLKQSAHLKASYITIVAYLAAPFFRDFDNYAIKIVLQMSIIMPVSYLIICYISAKRTQ